LFKFQALELLKDYLNFAKCRINDPQRLRRYMHACVSKARCH